MGRVKVKMELEFWYDPETNEYEPISNKVINDQKESKAPSKKKDDGSTDPIVTLEDNKFVLNSRAVELLNAQWEDRLSIQYRDVDGKKNVPVIAKDETLGTHSGNKLTKSNTVSCRGKANERLSKYGDTFILEEIGESKTFKMIGNVEPQSYVKVDKIIKVTESDDVHTIDSEDLEDIPLDCDLDQDDAVEIRFDNITL
jgi:hypothetical protein